MSAQQIRRKRMARQWVQVRVLGLYRSDLAGYALAMVAVRMDNRVKVSRSPDVV